MYSLHKHNHYYHHHPLLHNHRLNPPLHHHHHHHPLHLPPFHHHHPPPLTPPLPPPPPPPSTTTTTATTSTTTLTRIALLEEVLLCRTLNRLREHGDSVDNACTTFIQTLHSCVCQGLYNADLIRAWEQWDTKHHSENDHPEEFAESQCYAVFVQEHGGQDLESFVLLNFDEARSLLVQVTLALAVAEAAFQFEHRDLHSGNILLSRKGSATLEFTLEGRKIHVWTFGLVISIIDFTLSRINMGEDIIFPDLSTDPGLFDGPEGDIQFDTYRRMKEVTEDCWEGSFPKTNVLWLQYLVDLLLLKKPYDTKSESDMRSLKERLNNYGSAKEATLDPFFSDIFIIDIT